ncbi:BatA domain-containing protein [Mucilaginibacter segetis]|uniref:BatA domain-containing protein n=1 Tax=Mucilaginibacter segetis TaxID=2793071 RepID=A0A934UKV0_9SPHI|nr:BatA domain-containing protein [Mucilaginibacter segetis]MBK0377694.1 BatA domain-containing protein [Mucilaginibacter segetis]
MQFLNPIWFLGIAALSIPVAIHLWNIRQGKTLKVGSIALITQASKASSRSFKLLDILLLICRCLLLTFIAILLATPVWQYLKSTNKSKGWILIPRMEISQVYQQFKSTIDSLTKAGYEFHYLNKDFNRGDLSQILADTNSLKDTAGVSSDGNYWSLIKKVDAASLLNMPVYVFTSNRLKHFKGSKPMVGLDIHWQTYTAPDSVKKWIADAWMNDSGSISFNEGESTPSGTYFTTQKVKSDAAGNSGVELTVKNGQPLIQLKNSDQPAVLVDTSTLRMAVYPGKNTTDADYLVAALKAIANFKGRRAAIKIYNNQAQLPKADWLFWLSDEPINKVTLSAAANVFEYEKGKVLNTSSWIQVSNDEHIPLYKLITAKQKTEALWQDGFGKPVLSKQQVQGRNVYLFYSRFNPSWNDLVWSAQFPEIMLKLMNEDPMPLYDQRILSDQQIQPIRIKERHADITVAHIQETDLSKSFWLLAIALFVTERIIAAKKNMLQNG